ncbi:hypothetical protein STCU_03016 [Strigomonas culicis]|uniref:Trypanosoma Tc-38 (p38) protein domain-containing protein n=1 Tax=Strigomonas culicis TaxID=28005 RepID=S9UMF2_9TRYP|nr:hypothetical protein STCU_03016 [Strigomonas culicis]|eukprot:EPY32022.1 hypothetical protein STCU_03016 [Strigomonas culicis]
MDLAAEFLTCRGVSLAVTDGDAVRLRALTTERGYLSPFWLTLAEVELLFLHSVIWCRLQFKNLSLHEVSRLFVDRAVRLSDNRFPVLNAQELVEEGAVDCSSYLRPATDLFRIFIPVDVLTGKPFDRCIEDRIRIECIMSKSWCSIWGTPTSFQNAGIELFEDPIGIYVMDTDGNESFIISALSTKDPLGAYAKMYPNHFIYIA